MSKKATVIVKYVRISPKKIIPWLRLFKGKSLEESYQICLKMNNKSSGIIKKLLDSGLSACQDRDLDENKLYIEEIVCQTGPTMKRQLIRSRGRADIIRKRTSNIKLTLVEKTNKKKDGKKSKSGKLSNSGK
jgi:large subunit ribosomal protein L22